METSTHKDVIAADASKRVRLAPPALSTEVFKDKNIPELIKSSKFFTTHPIKINKIFPSIGLTNYSEPCTISKPMVDVKKPEGFVVKLCTKILTELVKAYDDAKSVADKIQYGIDEPGRDAQLEKAPELYKLTNYARELSRQFDSYNNNYEKLIQVSDGKLSLRLSEEILDNGKAIFTKGESVFKALNKLRERFLANNIEFINLEQTKEFKDFSAENVPNKGYKVIFSSDGKDGAWDLLTMSMRGFQSCQRWEGEYRYCLIGSILSKYVGIMYITSGADFEGYGSKMMRRSIVRYVIDAEKNEPCLIIDRVYPAKAGADIETETFEVFKKSLAARLPKLKILDKNRKPILDKDGKETEKEFPIYFGPSLGNKVRSFYTPGEKIRAEVPERTWSYQDTPMKSDLDFKLYILDRADKEDAMRYVTAFETKLGIFLADEYRTVYGNAKTPEDIRYILQLIRMYSALGLYAGQVSGLICSQIGLTEFRNANAPLENYKHFLLRIAKELKNLKKSQITKLNAIFASVSLGVVPPSGFYDLTFGIIASFIKKEYSSLLKNPNN